MVHVRFSLRALQHHSLLQSPVHDCGRDGCEHRGSDKLAHCRTQGGLEATGGSKQFDGGMAVVVGALPSGHGKMGDCLAGHLVLTKMSIKQ